jgi:hypothetical protein
VSFETIEHLAGADQPRMLAEIARVLTADGVLVLSAPNPVEYSQARNYSNPFHLHEPTRDELEALLAPLFPVRHWYAQRRYFGSAIWNERREGTLEAWSGDSAGVEPAVPPVAMYFVVVAARDRAPQVAGEAAYRCFAIATTRSYGGWMPRGPRSSASIGYWANATPRWTSRPRISGTSRTSRHTGRGSSSSGMRS